MDQASLLSLQFFILKYTYVQYPPSTQVVTLAVGGRGREEESSHYSIQAQHRQRDPLVYLTVACTLYDMMFQTLSPYSISSDVAGKLQCMVRLKVKTQGTPQHVTRTMTEKITFEHLVQDNTVEIDTRLDLYTLLPALLNQQSLFMHGHMIGYGAREWPETSMVSKAMRIITTLAFSGPLNLEIVTLNLENITTYPASIAKINQVPNVNAKLHIALGGKYIAMMTPEHRAHTGSVWVSTTPANLEQECDKVQKMGENVVLKTAISRFAYASAALAFNKTKIQLNHWNNVILDVANQTKQLRPLVPGVLETRWRKATGRNYTSLTPNSTHTGRTTMRILTSNSIQVNIQPIQNRQAHY
jgi:hypothetical protein